MPEHNDQTRLLPRVRHRARSTPRLRACLDCGRPTTGNRCGCTPTDNERRHEKAKTNELHSTHWRKTRAERLALAADQCELRLRGCTITATTVHLDPRLAGNHLAATTHDCLAACHHCHGTIDAPRASRTA